MQIFITLSLVMKSTYILQHDANRSMHIHDNNRCHYCIHGTEQVACRPLATLTSGDSWKGEELLLDSYAHTVSPKPILSPGNATMTPPRVPHVHYNRSTLTIQDMHRHRQLLNYLLQLYINAGISNQISPESSMVLGGLTNLSFVPAFFQVWTLCRYGELNQIRMEDVKSNSPFVIRSSKSKHVRTVPALPFRQPAILRQLSLQTKLNVSGYDAYSDSLARVKKILGLELLPGHLDCTHIFRHLEASWMFDQGIPISDISYKLGHLSDQTTHQYIRSMKKD
ncbi:hypothetical protein ES708_19156 [subsurface metagenome]